MSAHSAIMAPPRAPPRRAAATGTCRYPSGVVAYRCRACGNRTRFDVVTTSTSRAYHHYSLGGQLTVEDTDVVTTEVVSVTCRWCGNGTGIEPIDDVATVDPT